MVYQYVAYANNKINYAESHLAHQGLAGVKTIGWIFWAALSPFLTQPTIHSKEQIVSQYQHKCQEIVTVQKYAVHI